MKPYKINNNLLINKNKTISWVMTNKKFDLLHIKII